MSLGSAMADVLSTSKTTPVMVDRAHHRHRSSRALFSADLWKSLGRSRSRSVALGMSNSNTDLSRYPSGLSCDPGAQPLPPAVHETVPQTPYTPSVETSKSGSLRRLHLRRVVTSTPTATPHGQPRQRKVRPLSWFSLSKPRTPAPGFRSPSMPLPQQDSMTSVSKSSISTPLLTSTTNPRVADVEKIQCSDVLLPRYPPRAVANASKHHSGKNKSLDTGGVDEKPSTWAATIRSVKKTISHTRRASTSLLLETPRARRVAGRRGYDTTTSALPHRGHVDACKDKLNQITGRDRVHGHDSGSKDKSAGEDQEASRRPTLLGSQPASTSRQPPLLPSLYHDGSMNRLSTSLSRSFASAIDKLDTGVSPALVYDSSPSSRLQRARSFFSLNKGERDQSSSTLANNGTVVESSRFAPLTQSTDTAASQANFNEQSNNDGASKSTGPFAGMRKSLRKRRNRHSKPWAGPVPMVFSGKKNRMIPVDANEPLGNGAKGRKGVNPLRMHTEVMSFARPPAYISMPVTPGQESAGHRPDEDDGAENIQKAMIYSPSTDDISEYSRETPASIAEVQIPARHERVSQDTPTKKPLHKRSSTMLKKSVSSLFSKSTSIIKIHSSSPLKSKSDQDLPTKRRDRTSKSVTLSFSMSALDGKPRSKSVSDLSRPDGMRAEWGYQPATPSPLRASTRLSMINSSEFRMVTTRTPVRVPVEGLKLPGARSATLQENPEKRYGMVVDDE